MNKPTQKQGSTKRYKHKITYWLPAIIYFFLMILWIYCSDIPASPMAVFVAVLIGCFVVREICCFFKDLNKGKRDIW